MNKCMTCGDSCVNVECERCAKLWKIIMKSREAALKIRGLLIKKENKHE